MVGLRHKKEAMKHGGKKHGMHHRKDGGATKNKNEHMYNAVGSPEASEAKDAKDTFKRGGMKKKKEGGHVEHEKSKHRPDKKPRRAAGGSVMSSASKKTAPDKDGAGQGHEKDGPKGEDPDRGCYKSGGNTNWIAEATKNKGALHRALHVPEGQKIPASKLAKAAHSSNPTMRKRANLAKTLKGMH